MSEIDKRKQELKDEYGFFGDPQELFEYIINKNKFEHPLADEFKREEFLVRGCVSSLWLVPSYDSASGCCHFKSDADSVITRGVSSLVCALYDGLKPEQILSLDPEIFAEIGVSTHLSPNRRNGLSQLCNRIMDFAKAAKTA